MRPDDQVWSYDQQVDEWRLERVNGVQQREYFGDVVILTLKLDNGSTDEITCTGNHPFWVIEGEQLAERPTCSELPQDQQVTDASGSRWTEARWLRLSDKFLTRTGVSATVAGLTIRMERVKVYNLQVNRLQLYAVGDTGVLVHNNSIAPRITNRYFPTQREAMEQFSKDYPDLPINPTYGKPKPLRGHEIHPSEPGTNELPHIKFWD